MHSTIVIPEHTALMPSLDNTEPICISALVSPALGKTTAHEFNVKVAFFHPCNSPTVDKKENQNAKNHRKRPAPTPMAFQISPTGMVEMPRKPGGRMTCAWLPRVMRA